MLSALAALLAVLAAVVLLSGRDAGSSASDPAASGPGTSAAPAEFGHVHGLGVDPADGTLYAGTHYGLFRVEEGAVPTLVGDRVQDFMGFSIAGPGRFLASGHPGAGQPGPGNLGLIESVDGGQSWDTLSLAGEADFHVLKARHDRVYGSSGGVLMVSEDKETWDERAKLPVADLAVSPEDPDALYATTQQGLALSVDGGRTFSLVEDAPLLYLLGWAEGGTFTGLDPSGVVHVSEDGGASWEERGNVGGQAGALTVADDAVYVALENRVVVSRDGGRTFEDYSRAA